MSEFCATADRAAPPKPAMNVFERFLTFWVALCIIVGIALGQLLPGVFRVLGDATVAQVNLPVAVLVWLMIVPMLLKIDLAALREVGQHWRGIASTVGVNWLIKPFSMALLAWIFIAHFFRPFLPADQVNSYIAGLILLAAAPCTAMVFVWSNLVDGEPHFTLCARWRSTTRSWWWRSRRSSVCCSVSPRLLCRGTRSFCRCVLYIVVPVIVAQLWRAARVARGWIVGILARSSAVSRRCRSARSC